jgi:hypothetical protein
MTRSAADSADRARPSSRRLRVVADDARDDIRTDIYPP